MASKIQTRAKISISAVVSLMFLLSFNNCSEMSPFGATSLESSSSDLAISPINQIVAPGATLQFRGVRGSSPYTYYVTGGGSISVNGLYTAPASITSSSQTATIYVTDSIGTQASTTVMISGSSALLTVTYSPSPATPGSSITLSPTGGTPPYTYTLLSGMGSMSGNIYRAPYLGETASIRVADANGYSTTVAVSVIGANSAVTGLYITPYGTHQPSGGIGNCTTGYALAGKIADATGASGGSPIYGDQMFCVLSGVPTGTTTVLSDLYMTSGACNSGYSTVSTIEDCTGGSCHGATNFCASYRYANTTGSTVVDFYVSPPLVRSVTAPACSTGYTQIGVTADCSYGQCYGLQSFCVLKQ